MGADDREKVQQEAIEKLLGRAVRRNFQPGGDSCPAPDLLAAYHEQTLATVEKGELEAHLAGCMRCQEVLAALAVSEPAHATTAEFGVAAAAEPGPLRAANAPAQHAWFAVHWRWLVPAASVAAVAALWLAVGRAPSRTEIARVNSNVPAPAVAAPSSTGQIQNEEKDQSAKITNAPSTPAAGGHAAAQGKKPLAFDALKRKGPTPSTSARAPGVLRVDGSVGGPGAARGANAGTLPAPPVARTPATPTVTSAVSGRERASDEKAEVLAQMARQQLAEKAAVQQTQAAPSIVPSAGIAGVPAASQSVVVVPGAPTPLRPATEQKIKQPSELQKVQAPSAGIPSASNLRDAEQQTEFALRASAALAPQIISTPDRLILWRIGMAGRIERSQDGGQSWKSQSSGTSEELLAGSAPTAKICWVAGANGIILRTTDGEHWEKIASPEPLNWVRIAAKDAQRASVISKEGKSYATSDGGRNWQRE